MTGDETGAEIEVRTTEEDQRLAMLHDADMMLEQASTIPVVKGLRDMAEAARVYAQQAKLSVSLINHATAIKLRAEVKMANLVDEGQRSGQIAEHGGDRSKLRDPNLASLGDLGLSARQVHEARQIRDAYTDEQIVAVANEASDQGKTITRSSLIRQATAGRNARRKSALSKNDCIGLLRSGQADVGRGLRRLLAFQQQATAKGLDERDRKVLAEMAAWCRDTADQLDALSRNPEDDA